MTKMTKKKTMAAYDLMLGEELVGYIKHQDNAEAITGSFNAWQEVRDFFNRRIRNGPIELAACDELVKLIGNYIHPEPPAPLTIGDLKPGDKFKFIGSDNEMMIPESMPSFIENIREGARVLWNVTRSRIGWAANGALCELVKEK